MGAARMGDDPATSVTDGDNRAHDVPNLFIADSSSLPTGGGVNPTSTIQAVALRCAETIWEMRRELG
jgi:choline dehydrogenase-like flavoprotein